MGGRDSKFRTNANTNIKFSNNGSFEPLIDAEDDTISERNNEYIDMLQDEKINFCKSYGLETNFEFFAETFSNLVTSKNPTTLAKSLEIYIKENL